MTATDAPVAAGTWVEIHRVVLHAHERAPQIPDDTRVVPLELRVKGFLAAAVSGTVIDPEMLGDIWVTVVATGLGAREKQKQPYKVIKTGTGTADYEVLDTPTLIRHKRRLEAVEQRAGDGGMEYLDIPAFLRRQAD